MELEEAGLVPFATLTTTPGLLGGKVHGSLARAGKVKGQTPKVDAEEKKKAKTGRAKRRMQVSLIRFFLEHKPTFSVQSPICEHRSRYWQEEGPKF